MKHLLIPAVILLTACGGESTTPVPFAPVQDDTPITVQPEPVTINNVQPEPVTITPHAGFDPSGQWYCASYWYDNGQYRADWNNPWQLDFQDDMTVVLQDGSNSLSAWWFTNEGLAVQWSHNTGQVAEYVVNLGNRGGMSDSGSHCLRELPPVEVADAVSENPVGRGDWICHITATESGRYQLNRQGNVFLLNLSFHVANWNLTEQNKIRFHWLAGSSTDFNIGSFELPYCTPISNN